MSSSRLAIEALSVGVMTVVAGIIVLYLAKHFISNKNLFHKDKKELYILVGALLITGMLIHLLCEFTGLNHWYCANGNACI